MHPKSSRNRKKNKKNSSDSDYASEFNAEEASKHQSRASKRGALIEKKNHKKAKERAGDKKSTDSSDKAQGPNQNEYFEASLPILQPGDTMTLGKRYAHPNKPVKKFQKLLKKPEYLKIAGNQSLCGHIGHATAIFRRPIVEGSYYIQFKIQHPENTDYPHQHPPAIRIGLCPYNYEATFPLGKGQSFAYKSEGGNLVTNGKVKEFGPDYNQGDIIGMAITVSPPHKYPSPTLINQGSTTQFYKNGQLVGQYQQMKQEFYCIAVSLFNFAKISVLSQQQAQSRMPKSHQSYFSCLQQNIPYKSLEHSRILHG